MHNVASPSVLRTARRMLGVNSRDRRACLNQDGTVLGGHGVIPRDENPGARPVSLREGAEKVGIFVRIYAQLRSRYGISAAIPKLSGKPSRKVSVDNDQTETSPHATPGT
jgi:hypothetical protein